ncbi:MAG TPA: SDR family oxidoreductase [Ktedonobacteraceae bacterium]|nr:SDR family oxidoreductase [Ktedonobacteraceae bacterium]
MTIKDDSTTKTALITGASQGLGLALAKQLAQLRWRLIINARTSTDLEAARHQLAAQTHVTAISGDVTDPKHRELLLAAAQQAGGLDLLINNAGMLGPDLTTQQPELLEYPLDVLEQVFRTNVIAPLAIIQTLKDTLKSGAILINITSDAAVEAYPRWGGYGASKSALEQLSAILAAEQPEWRVYRVDPGDMRTAMHQAAFPGEDISDRPLPETSVPGFIKLINGNYPSGRYSAQKLLTESPAHT